jgi:hypothetical protein
VVQRIGVVDWSRVVPVNVVLEGEQLKVKLSPIVADKLTVVL